LADYSGQKSLETDRFMPVAGFRNLTCLEIYNFQGSESSILPDIASTLRSCYKLKILGLGMACDTDNEYNENMVILRGDLGFLERLSLEYSMPRDGRDQTIGSPLRLEKLRLGTYLSPYKAKYSPIEDNYLAKLFQLDGLRELHIWNGEYRYETRDVMEKPVEIHWPLFNLCRSLQQLQITRLEDDITEWINEKADSLKDLVIAEQYYGGDKGYWNFSRLNLRNLAGLYIRDSAIRNFHTTLYERDSSWSTYSDESEDGNHEFPETYDSQDHGALGTNNSEPLLSETESESGLESDCQSDSSSNYDWKPTVTSPGPHLSVLDYLPDKGIHLRKLGISIQFETQWASFQYLLISITVANVCRFNFRNAFSKCQT
jgi:hypothetical protein